VGILIDGKPMRGIYCLWPRCFLRAGSGIGRPGWTIGVVVPRWYHMAPLRRTDHRWLPGFEARIEEPHPPHSVDEPCTGKTAGQEGNIADGGDQAQGPDCYRLSLPGENPCEGALPKTEGCRHPAITVAGTLQAHPMGKRRLEDGWPFFRLAPVDTPPQRRKRRRLSRLS